MKQIYLDYAAATPLDSEVLQAMQPFFSHQFYNPSALYVDGLAVRRQLEQSRSAVAGCIGARPSEIIFTAGGSEANNLAISGLMRLYPNSSVIISTIEHESVQRPAAQYHCKTALVNEQGVISVQQLKQLIDDQTVLISIMLANNEIGSIQPLKEISQLISNIKQDRQARAVELPLYLHSDACQAANYLDINAARLGVDLLTLNGGKIYGPKQSGILYIRAGVELEPLIKGGGQEFGLRSGTENVPSCIGFAAALVHTQAIRKKETSRLQKLQKIAIDAILGAIPTAILNGPLKNRLPNNLNISFGNLDNERLLMRLDSLGVQCATGSACSASSDEPSHVLAALGLDESVILSSLRFSMGRATEATDIKRLVEVLQATVAAELQIK